jgi:hypothetical protein
MAFTVGVLSRSRRISMNWSHGSFGIHSGRSNSAGGGFALRFFGAGFSGSFSPWGAMGGDIPLGISIC